MINGAQPVRFPLYTINTGLTDNVHRPSGQLPLVCFVARQLKPTTFERATDSDTIRDIIYKETGFDMDVTKKEDLHKETRDQNLSAMSFHSDVSKAEEPQQEVTHVTSLFIKNTWSLETF